MMKRYGFSLRGMIKELYYRSGSRRAAGLKRVPSKSWLQKWPKRLPMDLLDGLILFTAGKAAYVYISVDSTHHRFNRYVSVEVSSTKANRNGKKAGKDATPEGKKWIADTCKHHALITPNGIVLASIVTDRNTADSPCLRRSAPRYRCQDTGRKRPRPRGQRLLFLGQLRSGHGQGQGSVL